MRLIPLSGLMALLVTAGCMSPEEIAQRQAYERALRDQNEIYECQNLGFEQGTEEFGNCRLQLRNIQAQQQIAQAQAAVAAAQENTIIVHDGDGWDDRHDHDDRHDNSQNNNFNQPAPQPAPSSGPGPRIAPAFR